MPNRAASTPGSSSGSTRASRLGDHGAIGDGRSTALVASNGDIDWYAPDGIASSPSCFSLVDARNGGSIRLGPVRPDWEGAQSYAHDESPLLSTVFETAQGSFEILDHLSAGRIVRVLTVTRGRADVVLAVRPGSSFGSARKVSRWTQRETSSSLTVETIVCAR